MLKLFELAIAMAILLRYMLCLYRFDLVVDNGHVVERYATTVLKTLNGIKLKMNHAPSS